MCPVMIITIYFEADHKKLVSSQKSSIFGPQKGHFGQLGPQNGPPSGQTGTYRKTEGIQSYLRIWRSCHPIESGPSEPKKGWFHRCSVKKCRIFGQKCSFLAPNPFFSYPSNFFCHHHDGTPKRQHFSVESFARVSTKKWFRAKNSIFGPQKGHFGQSGPRNGPPGGQTATYQKTEGIQSYLRIWGTYDPIESGPSEPKKWGFHRCSVKKCRISGRKCSFLAQNPFFCQKRPTILLPS